MDPPSFQADKAQGILSFQGHYFLGPLPYWRRQLHSEIRSSWHLCASSVRDWCAGLLQNPPSRDLLCNGSGASCLQGLWHFTRDYRSPKRVWHLSDESHRVQLWPVLPVQATQSNHFTISATKDRGVELSFTNPWLKHKRVFQSLLNSPFIT